MEDRGWDQVDFVYVTGDAYVDHSSFGTAIISRLLESRGYKVGIIPQPDWRRKESIAIFGEPRLGFLVSAGNMDSMVNHYTVAKSTARRILILLAVNGLRPDRAVIVYSNLIRQTFKKTPVILGGIEASLRRMAHYDYWENKVKHSILIDSGADLISYGMGEHSILRLQRLLTAESLSAKLPMWQEPSINAGICPALTSRSYFLLLMKYRRISWLMPEALPSSIRIQILLQQEPWPNPTEQRAM